MARDEEAFVTAFGRAAILVAALFAAGLTAAAATAQPRVAATRGPTTVGIFHDVALHFHPDSASKFAQPSVAVEDKGRVARTTITLVDSKRPQRITALVSLRPVPKSDRDVADRYDRAGNVRLAIDGGPDLEILRFMTAYGGRTDYEVDVTHLAPLLRGRRTFRAYVDTWLSPAWRLDFSLRYTPADSLPVPTWAAPVYYSENFNAEANGAGESVTVTVPKGLSRVVMKYVSTGHCTDGRDEDEFVSKANVISVDGVVVARVHPWRDDCRRFRDRNPYCARWTDGSWSSDYSRSGWCPSQDVTPMEFDLTDHLTPGPHTVRFAVEGMRPKDKEGNYGYWRLSACLVGWDKPPALWRNE
ncbi:MAG TPA: peptide-N-glycosidase F-related protein [Candidatus Eisenbacteria bacterium]|nr:peptide-N-glycosidase F-related protein [Candidatus Eisenbacteria bacterium]